MINKKMYLTRVIAYKSDGTPKCDVSTIPVVAIESTNGIITYKSQVSNETVSLPKDFHKDVFLFRQTVIYYSLLQRDTLEEAKTRSIEMILNHFSQHHFLTRGLYLKFSDVVKNHFSKE